VPDDASPSVVIRRRLADCFEVTDVGSAISDGRIDIYVGLQDRLDMNRSPAALNFRARAEVSPLPTVARPSPGTNPTPGR